jgi:hypothetical protein
VLSAGNDELQAYTNSQHFTCFGGFSRQQPIATTLIALNERLINDPVRSDLEGCGATEIDKLNWFLVGVCNLPGAVGQRRVSGGLTPSGNQGIYGLTPPRVRDLSAGTGHQKYKPEHHGGANQRRSGYGFAKVRPHSVGQLVCWLGV